MKVHQCIVMALVCGCLAGCSSNDNRRATAPVQVTVTYKGKPVEGALVQFIAVDDPQPAVGVTNSEGQCALQTYEPEDGAIVGQNSVTITKNAMDSSNVRTTKAEDADLIGITPPPILKSLIPKKYASPATSGLKEEVKDGTNAFTYELKD